MCLKLLSYSDVKNVIAKALLKSSLELVEANKALYSQVGGFLAEFS